MGNSPPHQEAQIGTGLCRLWLHQAPPKANKLLLWCVYVCVCVYGIMIIPQVHKEVPDIATRGIKVVSAIYGDLHKPEKTIDVTPQITTILKSQQPFGRQSSLHPCSELHLHEGMRFLCDHFPCSGFDRRFYFCLPKGSKNALPGFVDPARGVDKQFRLELLVDGASVCHTIDEYAPLTVTSCLLPSLLYSFSRV